MVGAVGDRGAAVVPVQHPGEAAVGLRMDLVDERQRMTRIRAPVLAPELARAHRLREHVARAADEVARACVVDAAVVLEELEKSAGRIDAAPFVEGHRVGDVGAQERGGSEVGRGLCGKHAAMIGDDPGAQPGRAGTVARDGILDAAQRGLRRTCAGTPRAARRLQFVRPGPRFIACYRCRRLRRCAECARKRPAPRRFRQQKQEAEENP